MASIDNRGAAINLRNYFDYLESLIFIPTTFNDHLVGLLCANQIAKVCEDLTERNVKKNVPQCNSQLQFCFVAFFLQCERRRDDLLES